MAGLRAVDELFTGRHFDREVIVLCVRWYLRFKLSFRDLVEMMAERGLSMAHTTVMRWVHHYAPEFERQWNRFSRPVGPSWRVDETYVKIRGERVYLYRAVPSSHRIWRSSLPTRAVCRSPTQHTEHVANRTPKHGDHRQGHYTLGNRRCQDSEWKCWRAVQLNAARDYDRRGRHGWSHFPNAAGYLLTEHERVGLPKVSR